jgi:hypothetical protein
MSIAATSTDATDSARPELRLIPGGSSIDLDAAERAVADLLLALGQDPDDAHVRETPRRVACTGLLRDDSSTRAEFFTLTGVWPVTTSSVRITQEHP